MKQPSLFILFNLLLNLCFAQNISPKTKAVYFELLGSGGFGSLNFEKQILRKNKTDFYWGAGFSIAPIDKNNGIGLVFPLMIHTLLGEKAHRLELGLGQGLTLSTKGSFFALTTAAIGYRYQPESKNWFCRLTYTPLISYLVDFQVQQWGGISMGYRLNKKAK